MIQALSKIYTESAGSGAMVFYAVGAIVVLFSTLFAGSAAWTRMFSDAFSQVGLLDYSNVDQRQRWIRGFAWFFPLAWTVLGLTFKAPVAMVTAGGIANAGLLLLVVYAAYTFRYRHLHVSLSPPTVGIATWSVLRCAALDQLSCDYCRRYSCRCACSVTVALMVTNKRG